MKTLNRKVMNEAARKKDNGQFTGPVQIGKLGESMGFGRSRGKGTLRLE